MSQLAPLPSDLPFRIISKTIGRGAYASIRKAIPATETNPVFAVKFIHKAYAVSNGRISAKQIAMEVSLHSHIGQHPNVIEWFATGEDQVWRWIAMEYAEGGDLFDKIEADVGVSEEIAHFYFTQLVNGVSYMHSKGVGHRDIKPENILLSESGDLKIADFGLATLFQHKGSRKLCTTLCGSPPYIAPEVISGSKNGRGGGYFADQVDIWSCGVVLFVLLVGNTPWDEPTPQSWEFEEYCRLKGRSSDNLWEKLPSTALSLIRGMMNVDPSSRFGFEKIKRHPWYTRKNQFLTADGKVSNQLDLAIRMLENLKIDFSQQPTLSQRQHRPSQDAMDVDGGYRCGTGIASTQPETPINDVLFDWERPPRINAQVNLSSSQPTTSSDCSSCNLTNSRSPRVFDALSDEPSMSQFTPAPKLPLSLTQHARGFRDIVPNYSLTRFFSHLPINVLIPMLDEALHSLNVPVPSVPVMQGRDSIVWIKVRALDERHCGLSGDILVDKYITNEADLFEVRLIKHKGDPLEWRRFFKKVVVLCKDGVYIPSAEA